jgi:hypothetical protein
MTNEIISLIADLALALSFIVGLIFGIAQVRAAARGRRERLTLETLRNFQSREFAELIHYITYDDMPASFKEWKELPAKDQILFTQFAQEMEMLGILVAEKLINIDLVDKTIGSLVTVGWEKFKIMIEDGRESQNDPFLCEYFQWLAERIDKKLRENPRVPFHEKK